MRDRSEFNADSISFSFEYTININMVATYKFFFNHVYMTGTYHMIEVVELAMKYIKSFPDVFFDESYAQSEEITFFVSKIKKLAEDNLDDETRGFLLEKLEGLRECIQNDINLGIEKQKQEQKKREDELREKKRVETLKETLNKEVLSGREEIGNQTPETIQQYSLSPCARDFDVLLEQLELLIELQEDNIKKNGKHAATEYSALVDFLIIKKKYAFCMNIKDDADAVFKDRGYYPYYAEPEELRQIAKYINCFNNGEFNNLDEDYEEDFAIIVVNLFGSSAYAIQTLEKLAELQKRSGDNNETLVDLLEDLYMLNAASDGTSYKKSTQRPFDLKRLITLAKERGDFKMDDAKLRHPFVIDVLKEVDDLFTNNGISLGDFFKKRELLKRYYPFAWEYNSGLDLFGRIVKSHKADCSFVRDHRQFRIIDGYLYEEGLTDRLAFIGRNNDVQDHRLIESGLAYYIRMILEFYMLQKNDTKVFNFKHHFIREVEYILKDSEVPAKVRKDYSILKKLINSNAIQNTIERAIRNKKKRT